MALRIFDTLRAGAVGVVSDLMKGANTVPASAVIKDGTLTGTSTDQLTIANPFTDDDERKLDALGSDGVVVSSGTATAVAIGTAPQNVVADRRPDQTPRGSWSNDTGDANRRPYQLHLESTNGDLTAVMTGSVADYAGLTLQIGERSVQFDHAQSTDTTISPGNTGAEFVWRSNYLGWLVVGANTWSVEEPITESRLLPDNATDGQYVAYNATSSTWNAVNAPTGGGGGISSVTSDDTLSGQGTAGSALGVTNPFTQADEDKLDGLGGESFTELYQGTVTAALNVRDTEAQRTPGQNAVGSFTGDSQLLRIHVDGDSGNLTLVLEGAEADYTGNRFRLGTRHVSFDDRQIVSVITPSRIEYEFGGDYSDWITAGTAENWAVLEPVDPFVDASVEGNALTFTTESGATDVVHLPGRPDPITKLPVPLVTDRLYNLQTADTIDQSVFSQPVLQSQTTQRNAVVNQNNFNDVRGYASLYSGPQAATVRDRTVLSFHTAQTANPPNAVFIGTAVGSQTRHAVSSTVIPNFGHTYLVANTFDYGDLMVGTRYLINVQFQDGSFLFPPTAVAAGVWVATSPRAVAHAAGYPEDWAERGTDVEIPLDRLPDIPDSQLVEPSASWAKAGQPQPVTAGVEELAANQVGPSIAISSSGQTAYSSAQNASPTFDLDDSDKSHGVIQMEFAITLGRRSNNTIAFEQAANQDEALTALTERDDGFSTITRLRATPAFAPNSANGVPIGASIPIYQGSSVLGNVQFYLTHDANNLLNWHFVYTGEAGTATFDITSRVGVVFQYADPPGTSGGATTPVVSADNLTGNADIDIPVGATVNTFGAAYTQLYRYTNATTNAQTVDIAVNLAGHADWNPDGGGDRALGRVRVRQHDSSASTTATILGDLNWYVRHLDINDNPNWINHWPLSFTVKATLAQNDYIQVEAVALTQATLGGNVVAENEQSAVFRTVH